MTSCGARLVRRERALRILRHREAEVRQGKRIVDTQENMCVVSYALECRLKSGCSIAGTTICSNSRAGLEPAQSGGVAERVLLRLRQVASAYHLSCTLRPTPIIPG